MFHGIADDFPPGLPVRSMRRSVPLLAHRRRHPQQRLVCRLRLPRRVDRGPPRRRLHLVVGDVETLAVLRDQNVLPLEAVQIGPA